MMPPAPASVLDRRGCPAFGTYSGHVPRVDWKGGGLRSKRWHFASVAGPRVLLGAAVVDVGWATMAFAYLFDRERRAMRAELSRLGLPLLSGRVSDRPGAGARSEFAGPGLWLRIEHGWRLRARGPGLRIDATLEETAAPLCAIAPIDGGLANCTHKTVCLAVRGFAEAGGARFPLDGCSGALDHTLGVLARETRWHWASMSDARVGFNLVEGFNGPCENAVWIDGRVQPVGGAEFVFDDPLGPWRIRAEGIDLTFTPEGLRREDKDLGFAKSRFVQAIGSFRGRACGREIRDLPGVTEDHEARW